MMNKKIKELSNNIKMPAIGFGTYKSVSYTHLDVYKRQVIYSKKGL